MASGSEKIFNNSVAKSLRQKLRNRMPAPEVILWSKIKGRQLDNLKFRRQYGIRDYVVDFYCTEKKLAIEIGGDSHYDEQGFVDNTSRDDLIRSFGIKILRFTNKEIIENIEGVLEKISMVI